MLLTSVSSSAVNHHHLVGVHGAATGFFADAQGVECGKGIGAELDARANFAKLRRLLQHLDGKVLPNQPARPPGRLHAAAYYQYGRSERLSSMKVPEVIAQTNQYANY